MTRPIFLASAETRLIIAAMSAMAVGETITYRRLSEVTSRNRRDLRGPIRTAMKRLLRDHDMVFGCVRDVGLKRLDDLEIVRQGAAEIATLRRRALRSVERQLKADFSALPQAEQMRASAHVSIMGAIGQMTREKSVETIAGRIDRGTKEMPVAQTLQMFIGKGGAPAQDERPMHSGGPDDRDPS